MKYAIMSDVHANPKALETALADAHGLGCEKYVFCGDVTGYGYDVVNAMKLVRENFDLVLMGNHDSACAGLETKRECIINHNYHLDVAQREQLDADDIEWLRSLKHLHAKNGVAFSHGDFVKPDQWGYIIEDIEALLSFRARSERLMFCGHTHHAQIWQQTASGKLSTPHEKLLMDPATAPESLTFKPLKDASYIINVGSVGYPRHDFCSTYVIYDTRAHTIAIRRLPFDFKSYIQSMSANRIPLPSWLTQLLLAARRSI